MLRHTTCRLRTRSYRCSMHSHAHHPSFPNLSSSVLAVPIFLRADFSTRSHLNTNSEDDLSDVPQKRSQSSYDNSLPLFNHAEPPALLKTGAFRSIASLPLPSAMLASAQRSAERVKLPKKRNNLAGRSKSRYLALLKLDLQHEKLTQPIHKVLESLPGEAALHPFERELVTLTLHHGWREYQSVQKEARRVCNRLLNTYQEYRAKMEKAPNATSIHQLEKQGESQLVKEFEAGLEPLRELKGMCKALRKLHVLDPRQPTVLLVGAPNVGKSSLVRAISSGRPEVQNYSFTTRALLVGHLFSPTQCLQVTDTPGLLPSREEGRNKVEQLTLAALTHFTEAHVVFVLDASTHSGYSIEEQLALRSHLRRLFLSAQTSPPLQEEEEEEQQQQQQQQDDDEHAAPAGLRGPASPLGSNGPAQPTQAAQSQSAQWASTIPTQQRVWLDVLSKVDLGLDYYELDLAAENQVEEFGLSPTEAAYSQTRKDRLALRACTRRKLARELALFQQELGRRGEQMGSFEANALENDRDDAHKAKMALKEARRKAGEVRERAAHQSISEILQAKKHNNHFALREARARKSRNPAMPSVAQLRALGARATECPDVWAAAAARQTAQESHDEARLNARLYGQPESSHNQLIEVFPDDGQVDLFASFPQAGGDMDAGAVVDSDGPAAAAAASQLDEAALARRAVWAIEQAQGLGPLQPADFGVSFNALLVSAKYGLGVTELKERPPGVRRTCEKRSTTSHSTGLDSEMIINPLSMPNDESDPTLYDIELVIQKF
eukprot:g44535.t1